jgi:sugar phosphate isomerase/epimerase
MARPITLFTGQWADLPFEEVARLASGWGYDGLEIACWGDHLDPWRGADDDAYIQVTCCPTSCGATATPKACAGALRRR